MKNIVFEDETVTDDDLYFICYMVERVGRKICQKNKYIVNKIEYNEWLRLISLASVLHCENPEKTEWEWIQEYHLEQGSYDRLLVDKTLVEHIPTATQMGKVYKRLILSTMRPNENYIDGFVRVYNDELCDILDDYNNGSFYEPSYCITRAYNNGGF
ncbi:MAG: hypothetical protein LUE96_10260 [Lachnospiraceae bacterium]|nr:hypothetical protein [Lachnospiraceae bacterium]